MEFMLVPTIPNTTKKFLSSVKLNEKDSNKGVYKIPCKNCYSVHIGENNDFKRRKYQHIYALKLGDQASSLHKHRVELAHTRV